MMRRVDLKAVAYWLSVVSLALSISWMLIDAYDELTYRINTAKAVWRLVSALMAAAALAFMLLKPPE
jgi:hypothetical protein